MTDEPVEPVLLSTRHQRPATQTHPGLPGVGDTVWVFQVLGTPRGVKPHRTSPPFLAARINVAAVERCDDDPCHWRVVPSPASRRFLPAEASELLSRLTNPEVERMVEAGQRTFYQAEGLPDPKAVLSWADRLASRPSSFISYRQADGNEAAFELFCRLLAEPDSTAVFFDRACIPTGIVERREVTQDEALEGYVRRKLTEASTVWCVPSLLYGAPGSYSQAEADFARATEDMRIAPTLPVGATAATPRRGDPWLHSFMAPLAQRRAEEEAFKAMVAKMEGKRAATAKERQLALKRGTRRKSF